MRREINTATDFEVVRHAARHGNWTTFARLVEDLCRVRKVILLAY